MGQGRSIRWSSVAFLAAGIALAAACGGASAPVRPKAAPIPEPKAAPVLESKAGPILDLEETCAEGEVKGRSLPVECGPTCTARGTEIQRCVEGRWNTKRIDADCALCPSALGPELAGCELEHITLTASEAGARDGCELRLRCRTTKVETSCDGENDGTNTSLCDCERDGVRDEHVLANPHKGEAPDACLAAAVRCRTPRARSPKLVD